MPEEMTRQVATSRDVHPTVTSDDTEYTLNIEQAVERYAAAGHPRTTRSIQRYCAVAGQLCSLILKENGEAIFNDCVANIVERIESAARASASAPVPPLPSDAMN